MAAEAEDSKSQHDYLGCILHPHRQRGRSDPGRVATALVAKPQGEDPQRCSYAPKTTRRLTNQDANQDPRLAATA